MINILFDWLNFDIEPFFSEVKKYIGPDSSVCLVPFSFRDEQARCSEDWERLYGEGGVYIHRMTGPLSAHGIGADRITIVNFFTDTRETAREKVASADVLVFPGGAVGKTVERIDGFGLRDVIKNHPGVIMGASAGAVMQLDEYFAPVYYEEYHEARYCRGLGLVGGFYHEVHYMGHDEQKEAIRRVLRERGKPVFATLNGRGALIVEDGEVRCVGEVLRFDEEGDVR